MSLYVDKLQDHLFKALHMLEDFRTVFSMAANLEAEETAHAF